MEPVPHKAKIRYHEIDLLRFLAAISVLIYHFTFRAVHGEIPLSPLSFPEFEPVTKYGFMGVELFFIISGYVVLMSSYKRTITQFLISRVTRLYPAFWVACTLTFITILIWGPKAGSPFLSPHFQLSPLNYVTNLSMLHSFIGQPHIDGVYWTLTVEIGFYFLIALLIGFRLFDWLTPIIAGWLLYVVLRGPTEAVPFDTLFIVKYAPYFAGGMLLYMIQTRIGNRLMNHLLLCGALLLSLREIRAEQIFLSVAYHTTFSFPVMACIIVACYLIMYAVTARILSLPHAGWLSRLGNLTYPLYLVHSIIGYIIFQHWADRCNKYVLLVGTTLLMLVLAALIHEFVEKRWSKRLGAFLRRHLESRKPDVAPVTAD